MIAKVCKEEGRGELWLGPLPTESRMEIITATKHSIQIYCLGKDPCSIQVDAAGSEHGAHIPGTLVFRCKLNNNKVNLADLRTLMPCLLNSLRRGDCAYVHCVTGFSMAPTVAAPMAAMLMDISTPEAQDIIDQVRIVRFHNGGAAYRGITKRWTNELLQDEAISAKTPTGYSCRTTWQGQVIVHATAQGRKEAVPICRWNKQEGESTMQNARDETRTVENMEEASMKFGGKFCEHCKPLMRASLILQVRQLWAD